MDIKEIDSRIYTVRGIQVMLDQDLAALYQVETRILNQAVKRNINRFPEQFRFRLTIEEMKELVKQRTIITGESASRSQFVTLNEPKPGRGQNIKYLPFVFTEQGVAMLSAILHSEVAIRVSIQIMQAFVNMRKFLLQNASVFQRLDQLEIKQLQTEEKIEKVFKALEKKWFAFSRIDAVLPQILEKLD